jgi:prepilin-type N-terminal cleavage/methylation domain-containing protein
MAPTPRTLRHGGFTLVELLVVIGIVVVLLSLLLPSLGRIRETAREAHCRSNLRQVITGFISFAADHDRTLPGNHFDIDPRPNADPARGSWLMGNVADWKKAPQAGTVYPYIKNPSVYRCPSLPDAEMTGAQGKTSNGKFDFAAFMVFTGARLDNIRQTARYNRPNGQVVELATPIVCEEDTFRLNLNNLDGGHSNLDQLGHQHRGGGHYASIDGSVHWFVEDANANAFSWFSQAPSGKMVTLGSFQGVTWGFWDSK